jgi:hypothetical protein
MAQRDVVKVTGGLVAGVAVAAIVLAASGVSINLFGDKDTDVTLSVGDGGSACTLGKETVVRVKRGKTVTWKIRNYCPTPQTVTVGNFRASVDSTARDCAQPTEGSVEFPFTEDARTAAVEAAEIEEGENPKPAKADVKMKTKDRGNQEFSYYFDICLGNQKADPRLIIER